MGWFEFKLKQKVKRELKAEEKQSKIDNNIEAANRRTDNNVAKLEAFSEQLEQTIAKYRQKAKEAQKINNKAAFNSYVAQIMNAQKMLDNNTLMMIDAIRHADSQKINRSMMVAQASIGDLVNPKFDISDKDMQSTQLKFQENVMNLTNALQRDENFASSFDGLYTGADTANTQSEFSKLANELIGEVAQEEMYSMDNFVPAGSAQDIDSLKNQLRREREALSGKK